jgi:hypothetical protein
MSVTTPIFMSGAWATDGAADADAAADSDAAGCDAAGGSEADGADADGLGVAPPPHAATRMARPANTVRPRERCRMCPPHIIEIGHAGRAP